MDRAVNPILRPLQHRAVADEQTAELSTKLKICLQALKENIDTQHKRRIFSDEKCQSVILQTDATWSRGKGMIGGLVKTSQGMQTIYATVKQRQIFGEPTLPINFLETITPTICVEVFKEQLSSSFFLSTIDNDCAKEALLSQGSGAKPHIAAASAIFWSRLASISSSTTWVTRVPSWQNLPESFA